MIRYEVFEENQDSASGRDYLGTFIIDERATGEPVIIIRSDNKTLYELGAEAFVTAHANKALK